MPESPGAASGPPSVVVDEYSNMWPIDRLLGGGGQGQVYSVLNRPYAVKILYPNATSAAVTQGQVELVRQMPLEGLPVAVPRRHLAGRHIGYLMPLADGMEPLYDLIPRWRDVEREEVAEWYLANGGLRRRLRILARLADVIRILHAKSIVYSDLSLANVLVAEDVHEDRIVLIDLDNLRYANRAGSEIGTPHFRAPEIARGAAQAQGRPTQRGTTLRTDAHSLAVIVYLVLTLVHPLLGGKRVVNGSAELELDAECGDLPWVGHPEDRSNAQIVGIPAEKVLTKGLLALARRAFEDGLTQPEARPKPLDWANELRVAAGLCLGCPHCHQTYFSYETTCPWCHVGRPRMAEIALVARDERDRPTAAATARLSLALGDTTEIRRAEALGDDQATTRDDRIATVRFERERLTYTAAEPGTTVVVDGGERAAHPGEPIDLPVPADGAPSSWAVRFGGRHAIHRIASIVVRPAAGAAGA